MYFNFNENIGSNRVHFLQLRFGSVALFGWQGSPLIDSDGPAEIISFQAFLSENTRQAYSGNQIVASVANTGGPGAVPEPATWAMMIMGFGVAGSLLRRRRIVAA